MSALANIDEDSPVDAEVAGVYKSNRKQYEMEADKWARQFAGKK